MKATFAIVARSIPEKFPAEGPEACTDYSREEHVAPVPRMANDSHDAAFKMLRYIRVPIDVQIKQAKF